MTRPRQALKREYLFERVFGYKWCKSVAAEVRAATLAFLQGPLSHSYLERLVEGFQLVFHDALALVSEMPNSTVLSPTNLRTSRDSLAATLTNGLELVGDGFEFGRCHTSSVPRIRYRATIFSKNLYLRKRCISVAERFTQRPKRKRPRLRRTGGASC